MKILRQTPAIKASDAVALDIHPRSAEANHEYSTNFSSQVANLATCNAQTAHRKMATANGTAFATFFSPIEQLATIAQMCL